MQGKIFQVYHTFYSLVSVYMKAFQCLNSDLHKPPFLFLSQMHFVVSGRIQKSMSCISITYDSVRCSCSTLNKFELLLQCIPKNSGNFPSCLCTNKKDQVKISSFNTSSSLILSLLVLLQLHRSKFWAKGSSNLKEYVDKKLDK